MQFCITCEKKIYFHRKSLVMCPQCFEILRVNSATLKESCYGLYFYRSLIRKLVHAVKIQGSTVALRYVIGRFFAHPKVVAVPRVDFVTSPPSSLWGRLRGRIDLAACLAQEFALRYQVPYITPEVLPVSWDSVWLTKEARKSTRTDVRQGLSLLLKQRRSCFDSSCLVIDDVMTTGTTVMRYLSNLPDVSVQVVTFAEVKAAEVGLIP